MMSQVTEDIEVLGVNGWVTVIRGVTGILFGILAFILPITTLVTLVLFFGAYALVDGLFSVIAVFRRRNRKRAWGMLLEGILSIVAGLASFLWPGITVLALVSLIAAWAFVTGALEIAAAIRLRKEIKGEWLLALSGVVSLLFGVLLVLWPFTGAVALVWMLGAYSILFGGLQVGLGLRLSRLSEKVRAQTARMAA